MPVSNSIMTQPIPLKERAERDRQPGGSFGTFGGVFTPCTLTILGVIMFLRLGYVVGNAGFIWALVILACAKLITTLTTFSLSAVATNIRVQAGGAYFFISRSLGVEFGGAIGIVFYLAQAISVSLYVVGFAEAFVTVTGGGIPVKVVAVVTNLLVFISVYIGAGWTIRVQYGILTILLASLFSFFAGGSSDFQWSRVTENLQPSYVAGENLFTMFGLFFPAVTGIMAGANMSGDLRNPRRSIPRGTLSAVAFTGLVYASMIVVMAGTRSASQLVGNNLIVSDIARWPLLITAGVFSATLSSGLGSMMGAPRILQALARDRIFPSLRWLGAGSGPKNEPRRAIIVTFVISTSCMIVADLNTIAPLITMAFMITYGTINLATFYESITRNPSYRPTFGLSHWSLSLFAAAACLAIMFLISWPWAVTAIVGMSAIYFFIYRKQVESRWGDLNSGLLFERTRKNLLKLERLLYHPKNWRPIILAMSGGAYNRLRLAVLGHWLASGNGILNLGQVIYGDVEGQVERIANQEGILARFIVGKKLEAFPNVVAAPTLSDGIEYLVQCSGLGALRPNTLLLGWPAEVNKAEPLVATLRVIARLKRNIVIAKFDDKSEDPWQVPPGTIDVWWRGHQNGELMLLLAHLLKQNGAWRNRKIRLMRVIASEVGRDQVRQHLQDLAHDSRIDVQPLVFVSQSPRQVIAEQSRHSAVVFLGFELPEEGHEALFYQNMQNFAEPIPRVLLVNSVGNMRLES